MNRNSVADEVAIVVLRSTSESRHSNIEVLEKSRTDRPTNNVLKERDDIEEAMIVFAV